eukprot:NODE_1549_length_1114_cov_353.947120.p1 GENE.NODE_1549_length_1114_cov_353.947120~~NODE_1549_length_1114_cov_353.947120.p1  ORF type:complete len:280 (+),score=85.61 NODE_1549_length_1114_cov_353.947120:3-842(+)
MGSSDGVLDVDTCKEAVADLGGNVVEHNAAAVCLCRHFRQLAFDAQGCRTAQDALDAARCNVRAALAGELRGHVLEAATSPHANFVLQKAIEELPPSEAYFIAEEFAGVAARYAKHRYAIRVFCRIVEHFPPDYAQGLLDEAMQEVAALCTHPYGHYLVEHVLEHGFGQHRAIVLQALLDDALRIAAHIHGSLVIECALLYLEFGQRRALCSALVNDTGSLVRLACSRFGRFVAKALLDLNDAEESAKVRSLLTLASESLEATKHGRDVLAALAENAMG